MCKEMLETNPVPSVGSSVQSVVIVVLIRQYVVIHSINGEGAVLDTIRVST
jgi:hypothetical protein